ncbi:accessory Sec system translocase SecA2 [Streptococcus cuniculipharyngis]|uniref:Protein translocase subunit SecA n=1 Tax=Streptococcus cuniculipharyngis TaxID=1562651 RepID=A0A5C5SF10_9STRE|nr:accessory Sec system translocase SecA2 [Streptococcus cuniculipharyngis]TWS98892.1 accessory Sec system translocase SecA2 [Streptococcus cuniculipharyngis]
MRTSYQLRRLKPILAQIKQEASKLQSLSEQALREKTSLLKRAFNQGQSLDNLLPQAFALAREVIFRQRALYLYDVQLLGAIVLHQGNIAEMKTGEGKTLTAVLPLYLHALTGKRTFLITPNAYLAQRDAAEVAPIFDFLGITLGVAVWEGEKAPDAQKKRAIYQADVVYTTSSQLGFDYLMDNLADRQANKFFPSLDYAIIDEADTVLLDMVQTPLIISGAPRVQSNLYQMADQFVSTLDDRGIYYHAGKKEVWLTEIGIKEAERFFNIEHLYAPAYFDLVRHLMLALKAHYLYLKQKDYLVKNEEIKLIDQQTGRLLTGTKLQGGLHQALEVKEQLPPSPELRTVATITYQNLFLLFEQLAGMTGTGKTAEGEFLEVYQMAVVSIPTHRPVQRRDLPDRIYPSLTEKIGAVLSLVQACHKKGQPVLLVTGSLTMSQLYSNLLLSQGLAHTLLNAKSGAREAEIIAGAGAYGAITIATQMAGRGTDIILEAGVRELGGLAVIATERFANERIDLQIRGRAGRQGDPGFSQFFVSLEDDLLEEYGNKRQLKKWRQSGGNKRYRSLYRLVKEAQAKSDKLGQLQRANALAFDKSIKFQRDLVYHQRDALLREDQLQLDLEQLVEQALHRLFQSENLSEQVVERYILDHVSYRFQSLPSHLDLQDKMALKAYTQQLIRDKIEQKQRYLGQDFAVFLRLASLKALDEAWIEEVDYLQQLRLVLSGVSASQTNPLFDYHQQAHQAYLKMQERVQDYLLTYLCLSEVEKTSNGRLIIYFG